MEQKTLPGTVYPARTMSGLIGKTRRSIDVIGVAYSSLKKH
jgi:hypothetical protein